VRCGVRLGTCAELGIPALAESTDEGFRSMPSSFLCLRCVQPSQPLYSDNITSRRHEQYRPVSCRVAQTQASFSQYSTSTSAASCSRPFRSPARLVQIPLQPAASIYGNIDYIASQAVQQTKSIVILGFDLSCDVHPIVYTRKIRPNRYLTLDHRYPPRFSVAQLSI